MWQWCRIRSKKFWVENSSVICAEQWLHLLLQHLINNRIQFFLIFHCTVTANEPSLLYNGTEYSAAHTHLHTVPHSSQQNMQLPVLAIFIPRSKSLMLLIIITWIETAREFIRSCTLWLRQWHNISDWWKNMSDYNIPNTKHAAGNGTLKSSSNCLIEATTTERPHCTAKWILWHSILCL